MREIKFRAWNKKKKEWLPTVVSIVFSTRSVRSPHAYYSYPEEVEIVEWTGLKDVAGRDVFEGDIIKCTEGCPHVIEWRQELGGQLFGGMPGWYLSGIGFGYAWTEHEEIIGNVYEHAYLLTPPQ